MQDIWTTKDIVMLAIGVLLSFFSAFIYETSSFLRRSRKFKRKYGYLESDKNEFDWQHWDIVDGKITGQPIESFMKLKYEGGKNFSYEFRNDNSGESGSGYISFDDVFLGKMSFWISESSWFNYRNLYYRKIEHKMKKYDAVFINADDQKTKYVMLRPIMT